jgi:histidine triad (HIT) family protein
MAESCLFCRIIAGEIPASIVHRSERAVVFNDINPQAPTHWLVISTDHTPSVSETESEQVFIDLMATARDVARQNGLSNYRLVVNNGQGAGQTVFHTHMHVLAGRPLLWPPG